MDGRGLELHYHEKENHIPTVNTAETAPHFPKFMKYQDKKLTAGTVYISWTSHKTPLCKHGMS